LEERELQVCKDRLREGLVKYTRKAFQMLPRMDKPRILDMGCGSGIPTLELARLSKGEVIGIDIDQPALGRLTTKIEEAGLTGRVKAVNRSMFDTDFVDASFDVIWSEGSIYAIGFERGLREWKRLVKPNGFMVVHDEQGDVTGKLEQISNCGYELLGYFILGEDTWWTEYFAPLEKLIAQSRGRHTDDLEVLEELHKCQKELDMFEEHPERNSSVYFIMKRVQ
jgi:ubiquinone/menaquinone biosynthesis C-methylase UbiE